MNNQPNRYEPSATMPVMTKRRISILKAFDSGSRLDLMHLLYDLAAEDLRSSLVSYVGSQRRSAKSSMEMMTEDRDSGAYKMFALLLSIPPPVLEALILNIIGYRYLRYAEFRKLFYTVDNSPGIYINTVQMLGRGGRSLNREEWYDVRNLINAYIAGHGVPVGPNTSDNYKYFKDVAMDVDNAFGPRPGARPFDVTQGKRHWMNAYGKTKLLHDRLKERDRQDLDPGGKTPQIQSPLYVGLGHNLAQRMDDHHPLSKLHNTSKTWGLVLSCMASLELEFKALTLPILKIWENDTILKGEALISMLSGSAVQDGGYNASQTGTGACRIFDSFDEEEKQIFGDNEWMNDNLAVAITEVKGRIEWLQAAERFDSDPPPTKINHLQNEFAELVTRREKLSDHLKLGIQVEQARRDELASDAQFLTESDNLVRRHVEYYNSVTAWLEEEIHELDIQDITDLGDAA